MTAVEALSTITSGQHFKHANGKVYKSTELGEGKFNGDWNDTIRYVRVDGSDKPRYREPDNFARFTLI